MFLIASFSCESPNNSGAEQRATILSFHPLRCESPNNSGAEQLDRCGHPGDQL